MINIDDLDSTDRSRSQSRSLDATKRNTVFALGFAEYRLDRWRTWTELAHYLGKDDGNVLSAGVEYRLPLTAKWSTAVAVGLSAGDASYMRTNFSIPPVYSLGKRPLIIEPKAGLRDVTLSTDFEYQANDHWRWNTVMGFTRSLAVIQQGTWVKDQSQPFVSTGIKYKF
jgi:outer membrane scaffolding protein for murein synthesis (MipA/OmpV family)